MAGARAPWREPARLGGARVTHGWPGEPLPGPRALAEARAPWLNCTGTNGRDSPGVRFRLRAEMSWLMETYNIYITYVLPCHDYFENMKQVPQTGGTRPNSKPELYRQGSARWREARGRARWREARGRARWRKAREVAQSAWAREVAQSARGGAKCVGARGGTATVPALTGGTRPGCVFGCAQKWTRSYIRRGRLLSLFLDRCSAFFSLFGYPFGVHTDL